MTDPDICRSLAPHHFPHGSTGVTGEAAGSTYGLKTGGGPVQLNVKCIAGWWCNNHLEKYEFVNGKDDIPYMKWKRKNVPNHQPDRICEM